MAVQLAHVTYVLTEQQLVANQGADYAFVGQPFRDPLNLALFAATFAFIGALIFAGNKVPAIRDRVRYFRGRARSYQDFIPWILRVCLGIALVGAGSQQTLMSPAVHNQPGFATLQIVLGFLIVTGLALTPALLGALALAIGALILHPTLVDNLEIITGLIAVLLLGQAKPGLDDLMGIPMRSFPEDWRRFVPFLLRFGLGASLVIMAITEKLMNPHLFGTVVETYGLTHVLPLSVGMWVVSAGLVELVLGLSLLLGIQTRIMSAVAFVILSLSFFYFGEDVYAHVTIFGTLFVLLLTGSGAWSLDNLYATRRQRG